MATTAGQEETSTSETEGQEEGQQQQPAPGTQGQEQQQEQPKPEEPAKLPEDHPLVKTLATQKTQIATLKTELAEARAQAGKVTQLEDDLGKRPTTEALEALQKRSDRLEEFLAQVPGPLGKALDSRSFTRELFESDKDIASIVKDFVKQNPTATSTALGSGSASPQDGKVDPNKLLRIAAGKE